MPFPWLVILCTFFLIACFAWTRLSARSSQRDGAGPTQGEAPSARRAGMRIARFAPRRDSGPRGPHWRVRGSH
jgi:hypothetical protein